MQKAEGVCANMKQECVFTAGGADSSDDGGRVGARFTFHLEGTALSPEHEDVWLAGLKAGGWFDG